MVKLSVIVLSYAIDEDVYQMNMRAIESLFVSEYWSNDELEVLLLESNREAKYEYDKRVTGADLRKCNTVEELFNLVESK